MARQRKVRSINSATSAGAGESYSSGGHNSVGLFVIARNLDPNNDTLEVVLDAEHQSEETGTEVGGPVRAPGGGPGNSTPVGITEGAMVDEEGDGAYAGFLFVHGVPAEFFRARISDYADSAGGDLEVDAWVYFGNWSGSANEFREIV